MSPLWTYLRGTCSCLFPQLSVSLVFNSASWTVPKVSPSSFCILSSSKTSIAAPGSFPKYFVMTLYGEEKSPMKRETWVSNYIPLGPNLCQFTTYPGKRKKEFNLYICVTQWKEKFWPSECHEHNTDVKSEPSTLISMQCHELVGTLTII